MITDCASLLSYKKVIDTEFEVSGWGNYNVGTQIRDVEMFISPDPYNKFCWFKIWSPYTRQILLECSKTFFLVLTNKQIKLDRVIQIYMSFKYGFHYNIIVDFVANSIHNLLKIPHSIIKRSEIQNK